MRNRVSLELAKAAKELGFNEYGTRVWHRGCTYDMLEDPTGWNEGGKRILYKYWNRGEDESLWIPTLDELSEWLRVKFNLNARVASTAIDCHFPMNELLEDSGTHMQCPPYKSYKTYEEAQEQGLLYAIQKLLQTSQYRER